MKRALASLALASVTLAAVFAVDYTAVGVEVSLNPADYYRLLERFERADTTLTVDDLRRVYFGYSFTPRYEPDIDYSVIAQACDDGLYAEAYDMCAAALEENPVSLELHMLALTAASNLRRQGKHTAMQLPLGPRCDMIATAILESGRGTVAQSPFQVINSGDVKLILHNVLGVDSIIDRTRVGDVDAYRVTFPGSDRRHILYFDNNRQLNHNQSKHQ